MNEKQQLAKRIKEARDLAGLSQGQTAKRLGMHRPTISEIEAGRRNVRADELTALAKLFGVESSWLINGEIDKKKIDKEILAAARELSSMKNEDLEILLKTIKIIKSKGHKIE